MQIRPYKISWKSVHIKFHGNPSISKFHENKPISNFMKIRAYQNFTKIRLYQISWKSVQWEPSCAMRTDRQTDMKLIVAFRKICERDYKWILQKQDGMAKTGLSWLRTETSGGILWTRYLTISSHKMDGVQVATSQVASQEVQYSAPLSWLAWVCHHFRGSVFSKTSRPFTTDASLTSPTAQERAHTVTGL